ncbi:lipase member I-like isoform X2 [Contarinia nasturtii]|uniref:lipase member I-like isoform X2 n=1 Tax=Contarinia nasturtii TaxID=265458 RepID=UPI0012D46ACB|nr:lipase member I-like isoform X2 [Contarinia nasturtii]
MDFGQNMWVTCWFPLILVVVFFVGNCGARLSTEQTKLIFFYGPNYFDHRIYDFNKLDEIVEHEMYNASQTTVLYIHGYLESPDSDSVHLIVNAYHARKEHNLIVLDWSDAAFGDYFIQAVPNSVTLGNIFATVVLSAFKKGLDREKFHVVGHSLGAQLAEVMGRKMFLKSNQFQKLKRITGLDPANPPFFPNILLDHLSHSDAEFVDIIHSDAGLYGQPISTGTIDFWPNDGMTLQPICVVINDQLNIMLKVLPYQREPHFMLYRQKAGHVLKLTTQILQMS